MINSWKVKFTNQILRTTKKILILGLIKLANIDYIVKQNKLFKSNYIKFTMQRIQTTKDSPNPNKSYVYNGEKYNTKLWINHNRKGATIYAKGSLILKISIMSHQTTIVPKNEPVNCK